MDQQSLNLLVCCGLFSFVAPLAQAKPWKGAEIQSRERFTYGAFEARIRVADGSGMITPFFLLKDGTQYPGVEWEEMDFEVFGRDGSRKYQTQVMTPGNPRTEHLAEADAGSSLSQGYHTYRMEWTPQRLAFYFDGRLVRQESDYSTYGKLLDSRKAEPMRLRLSLWSQDDSWSGRFDQSKVPAHVFVSYIKVEKYTPRLGSGGSDFSLAWRDDFWTFDQGRWGLTVSPAAETGNSDFVAENATVQDGYLILSLTAPNQLGFHGRLEKDADKGR